MEELATRACAERVSARWNVSLTGHTLWCVLVRSVQRWSDHRCMGRSAALAYYAAFSLAPILVIVIAVAGSVWGRDSVEGHVLQQFQGLLGQQGASLVQQVVRASHVSNEQTFAAWMGLMATVMGATALFSELSDAFSALFGRARQYRLAWLAVVLERLRGLGLVVGLGFLLLVSLVLSAALVSMGQWLAQWSDLQTQAVGLLQTLVSWGLLSGLFALMLKVLAPVRLRQSVAWLGGMVSALLFEVGKWMVGLYLGHSAVASVFGAAGTLAVLLVWLHYVSMTVLFGVALTCEIHALQHPSDGSH